ncbi:MAG: RNA pseudouridine synthase [Flammeovirgaceae bacterium]|nr:RNA pseudouridine synthase [Flammeovirgaceae bacterium]
MKRNGFSAWILFEDDEYIIVNKPPFISTLADRNDEDNVLVLARKYLPGLTVCHRLDKETSGVLVLAKHQEAYRHASMQFEHRQINKVYHAVVDGIHNFANERVDERIKKLKDGTVMIARDGKEAETSVSTMQAFKLHSLLECKPVTGRMHQIRIHLAWLKAPISGDDTYGGKPIFLSHIKRKYNLKKNEEELPLINRLALHAVDIDFKGIKGQKINVNAPYPKDFQALIRQLNVNSR